MACFKQYMECVGAEATVAAGALAIAGSGIVEAGSFGALTPAAAATFLAGVAGLIGGYAACIVAGMDLAECYDAAGQHDDAQKMRQKVAVWQGEHDRWADLYNRVQAAVS